MENPADVEKQPARPLAANAVAARAAGSASTSATIEQHVDIRVKHRVQGPRVTHADRRAASEGFRVRSLVYPPPYRLLSAAAVAVIG